MLALKGLEKTSGAAILSENTSTAVAEEALMMGLRVVRSKVGKTFVSLEKEGGVFATAPSKVPDPARGLWQGGLPAGALIAPPISKRFRRLRGPPREVLR